MKKIVRIELPTSYEMGTVNCFLIKGECPTLVDCGEDNDQAWFALQEGLKKEKLQVSDIERLVITHAHVDHIGMAQRIAQESGCEVWVSDRVLPWAKDVKQMWQYRSDIMRQSIGVFLPSEVSQGISVMFDNMSDSILKQWKNIDESYLNVFHHAEGAVEIGGEAFKVVYAPGHSTTQSCFFSEDTGQLLSADMLLRMTPTPVMDVDPGENTKRAKGIIDLLNSYERFRSMDITMVYPGHYDIFEDYKEKIDAQVSRIHKRKEDCFELINNGTNDLMSIFQSMYKGRWHLPAFNMTFAYIDLLEYEGRIRLHSDPTDIASSIVIEAL